MPSETEQKKSVELHPSLPPVDEEQVEMLIAVEENDDPSLLRELVTMFIEENEPRLPEVRQCCEARDPAGLRRRVHFFAGSTANLGILRVSRLCQQVEAALLEDRFDAFDELPDILEREYREGIAAIKAKAQMN